MTVLSRRSTATTREGVGFAGSRDSNLYFAPVHTRPASSTLAFLPCHVTRLLPPLRRIRNSTTLRRFLPPPPILRQICTITGVKFNFQNFDYRSDRRDVPFPGYILFLRFALLRTTTRFILIAHPLFILYHHPARSRAPVNLDSRFRIA